MTREQIRTVVLEALGEIAPEADASALEPTLSLREELDLDSMDFLRFVTELHGRLGVSVPEADYAAIDSIEGVVSYLVARVD